MSGLSKPVKKALKGFIEGDYAGNRARVLIALRDSELNEQYAAFDYARSMQTQHKDRQHELEKMLMCYMAYDILGETAGPRGKHRIGFSEEDINRTTVARTSQDE
jgi:hypothetical protein